MLKIELNPQEAQEIKEIYSRELENLQKRANEIREFLNQLESKPTVITPMEDQKAILSKQPAKQKAKNKIVKDKSFDSPHNWTQFIIDTLNKTKKVMTAKEFLNYATTNHTIPQHELNIAKSILSPTLSQLERKRKALKTFAKPREKGKSYGLSAWFNDDGELMSVY